MPGVHLIFGILWRRRALGAALLLLLASSCHDWTHERIAGFCCEDPDRCRAYGAPGPVACERSDEVCDLVNNRCVPFSSACSTDEQCSDPTPVCGAGGVCVGCNATSCSASAPVCAADMSACGPCTDEGTCARFDATPHCGANGACVACRPEAAATDCPTATAPVCDAATSTCRGCSSGSECPSGVCETSGACVDAATVAYVAETGSDAGTCTLAQPCRTIQRGVDVTDATRRWVLVRPGAFDTFSVAGQSMTILAEQGAHVTRQTPGPVVEIRGRSTVTIEGLRIHEGLGSVGDGIRCTEDGADAPTLTVRGVTIDRNTGIGLRGTCTLTVERSKITSNTGGGVSLASSTFTIRNTFIVGNGNATGVGATDFGGLRATAAGAASVLEFSTIAGNASGATFVPGVECTSTAPTPLRLTSNIIYGNTGRAQVAGNGCTFAYSVIGPDAAAGDNNIAADPMFVAPGADDYHIKVTSPAAGAADPATTLAVDVDGEPRPSPANTRADIGADEVTQ